VKTKILQTPQAGRMKGERTMKKLYQVVVNNDFDNAEIYETWSEAFDAAHDAFDDDTVKFVDIYTLDEDGDVLDDFPLTLVREDGTINQYRNGERLWL
jgi:hypothetical protein